MPDPTDSGTTVVDGGTAFNADLKSEESKVNTENAQLGNHLYPDQKDTPQPADADLAKSELSSEKNATVTGDGYEDVKKANHPRHGHWRHAWRHHRHPEWKGNMPIPSDADVANSDLTAEQKEKLAQYKRWQVYEAQGFPGHQDSKRQNEPSDFPGKFERPFPGDQQFSPPFPFYSPYHHHHFHCGGRYHGPKPTLQERLQREFDFI